MPLLNSMEIIHLPRCIDHKWDRRRGVVDTAHAAASYKLSRPIGTRDASLAIMDSHSREDLLNLEEPYVQSTYHLMLTFKNKFPSKCSST